MKTFRRILLVVFSILLVVAAASVLGGYFVYAKAKAETKPKIELESMESYAINIGNSLLKNRELEIPAEILSTIITEKSGLSSSCLVTDDNKLNIWFTEEVPYIGKADICLVLALTSFDNDRGELILNIDKIMLGDLEAPSFLKPYILELAAPFIGSELKLSDDTLTLKINEFTIDIMGTPMEIGIKSVTINEGKMFFSLFAKMD